MLVRAALDGDWRAALAWLPDFDEFQRAEYLSGAGRMGLAAKQFAMRSPIRHGLSPCISILMNSAPRSDSRGAFSCGSRSTLRDALDSRRLRRPGECALDGLRRSAIDQAGGRGCTAVTSRRRGAGGIGRRAAPEL